MQDLDLPLPSSVDSPGGGGMGLGAGREGDVGGGGGGRGPGMTSSVSHPASALAGESQGGVYGFASHSRVGTNHKVRGW